MNAEAFQANRRIISGMVMSYGLNTLSLLLFSAIIIFVCSTSVAEARSSKNLSLGWFLKIEDNTGIAIVQALQVILLALTNVSLVEAFETLHWTLIDSLEGLPYLSFLVLSPSTGYLGMISIVLARPWSMVPLSTRLWGFTRASLTCAIWVSGLVLFLKTTSIIVYDAGHHLNVTAGIGSFNGELVDSFFENLQSLTPPGQETTILPYTYTSSINMLTMNPLITKSSSPVMCLRSECRSYLMTGGLETVVPAMTGDYTQYQLARVDKAPSIQFDFSIPDTGPEEFSNDDCDTFGAQGVFIGIRLCVSRDHNDKGVLKSVLYVCRKGISGNKCARSDSPTPSMSVNVRFFQLRSTFIATRSNYSITRIIDKTEPAIIHWSDDNIIKYRQVLRWVLNFTAAGLPAPSSIVEPFWSASDLMLSGSGTGWLPQNFHNLLAFPFWLFNDNNWGNIKLEPNRILPELAPEFHTQLSFVNAFKKVKFKDSMFILYVLLQGISMLFPWAVLIMIQWRRNARAMVKMSEFPMMDIALRTRILDKTGSIVTTLTPYNNSAEAMRTTRDYRIILAAQSVTMEEENNTKPSRT